MKSLPDIEAKILGQAELLTFRKTWASKDQRVVFTNGCFDILHLGHVRYLAQAKDLGDILIVALNTDRSVKAQNKGEERPINGEIARLTLIAALGFVDAVCLFDGETPLDLILALQPDILVKGADYDPNETDSSHKKYIVGSKEVKNWGGKVSVIDMVAGYSTTAILQKGGK